MKTLDYLAAPLAALKAGDANKAIRMLEEILVVHPEVVETAYHLARAYEKAGDLVRARELYAEVLRDGGHPFFSHAQNRLNEIGGPPTVDETSATGEYAAVEQASEHAPVEAAPPEATQAAEATEPAAEPAADAAAQADAEVATEAAADSAAQGEAAADGGEAGKAGGKKKKK